MRRTVLFPAVVLLMVVPLPSKSLGRASGMVVAWGRRINAGAAGGRNPE